MGEGARDAPWLRGLVIAAIGAALGIVLVAVAVAGDGPSNDAEADAGSGRRLAADATSIADATMDPSPGGPPSDDSWGALGP